MSDFALLQLNCASCPRVLVRKIRFDEGTTYDSLYLPRGWNQNHLTGCLIVCPRCWRKLYREWSKKNPDAVITA